MIAGIADSPLTINIALYYYGNCSLLDGAVWALQGQASLQGSVAGLQVTSLLDAAIVNYGNFSQGTIATYPCNYFFRITYISVTFIYLFTTGLHKCLCIYKFHNFFCQSLWCCDQQHASIAQLQCWKPICFNCNCPILPGLHCRCSSTTLSLILVLLTSLTNNIGRKRRWDHITIVW